MVNPEPFTRTTAERQHRANQSEASNREKKRTNRKKRGKDRKQTYIQTPTKTETAPYQSGGKRLTIKRAEAVLRENIAEGKGEGDAAAARSAAVSKFVSTLISRNADMSCDMVEVNRKVISAN